jgi:predicted O-methyltransferase YrrM
MGETATIAPRALVDALYRAILRRVPGSEEVDYWASQLAGPRGVAGVVDAFATCPEAQGIAARDAGLYVAPGHYCSPVVNVEELRRVPPVNAGLPLISWDQERMCELWRSFAPLLRECPFRDGKQASLRYHFDNGSFSHGDGAVLYAMLRTLKPRRYVEVGSGYSSACLLDTLDLMRADTSVTFIEPYTELLESLLREDDRARVRIIAGPVQRAPYAVFDELQAGDILFIDSTHVAKTGSDVCHELFNVLPYLQAGVVIQFHDIFYPFEYPDVWIYGENRSWNELYLLRALLMGGGYEIVFFGDYFAKEHRAEIEAVAPQLLRYSWASLWLRKLSPPAARSARARSL